MGYLICKECGGYYELEPGESPKDPQNPRFWDPRNKVSEGFDRCQCGGELVYKKNLNDKTNGFNVSSEKKGLGIKLPRNSNMIKLLGVGILFIFGLLLKFHAFNFIIYYFMRSNSDFLSSSPMYFIVLMVLGFVFAYLGRFVRT